MNSPRSFGSAISCGDDKVSARRAKPGATRSMGADSCSTMVSAACRVRVICGIRARIGGSISSSNPFTRPAMAFNCTMVALNVSTESRNCDTPRWNCAIDF